MKVIFDIKQIQKYRRPVVAVGVFDGVHLAHQRLLKGAVELSRRIQGASVVVTFWPHPQKQESLYSLEHRLRLIGEVGIEVCLVIRFTPAFSRITAENFVKDILVKRIRARYICVGRNFRFGKNAEGGYRTLKRLSLLYHFKLKAFDVAKINKQPISSTYIRRLIKKGDLNTAQKLLCRPVSILGTVIKGSFLGRRLGFPTANIDPHHEVVPPSGVYAVKVIFNHKLFQGICYIGIKPTFSRQSGIPLFPDNVGIPLYREAGKTQNSKHIEVYIFNFKRNIYGKYLEIQFIKKIRDEKKFASSECLVEQIKKDIFAIRRSFSHPFPNHNI